MPQVIVTEGAILGLERCRLFLAQRNPNASRRAGQAIEKHFALLESSPEIGRPMEELPELRELMISFGESGYVALYRFDPDTDIVHVLAVRHQREAGYRE